MRVVVFFDLFETLVTQRVPDRPTGRSIAQELGLDETQLEEGWRTTFKDRMTGRIPDYPSSIREICRRAGHTASEAQITYLAEDRLRRKAAILNQVDLSIISVLQELRGLSFRLGVISNTTEDEIAYWESCALSPLVDAVVFSCRVGHMKPDAPIYHLACSKLGVMPGQCFFVGDGGSDELVGALVVGMKPIRAAWYVDQGGSRTTGIPSVSALGDLVQFLNERR